VTKLLDRFGLTNLATVQQKLADRGSQFLASQAIIIGQTTFEVIIKLFIMRRSDEFYAEKVSTRQNCRRCRGLENGQS
jgi:hypothetical protein